MEKGKKEGTNENKHPDGMLPNILGHPLGIYKICCLPVIMWFLFGEVFSSSGCLGWATLFYCGTP